jgi:hypothetical protein
MDNRRGGARDKPVSSYASLASGAPQYNNNSRGGDRDNRDHRSNNNNYDDQARGGGGRGYHSGGGRGRGRGRYNDYNDRFGRGGGAGRGGPSSFRSGGDRDRLSNLATNPVHSERFEPSPTASRLPTQTETSLSRSTEPAPSASPDRSGYESGEIMPGPQRPVAVPSRGGASSANAEGGRGAPSSNNNNNNNHDSGRAGLDSDSVGRGGGPGRSQDGTGPGGRFSGRGRGRGGGRFFDRGGGRGRGGGRMDNRFSGRGGDGRDNFSSSGRPGPEEPPTRFNSGEPPRNMDMPRKEPPPYVIMKKSDDDRGPPPRDRPLPPRDPIGGGGGGSRMNYPSSADNPDRFGGPSRMHDGGPDDRYGKRARDDVGYKADYDEKRPRNNDFGPRSSRPVDDGRSFPPMDSRSRPVNDLRRVDHDPRPMEPRRSYDGPPRRDDSVGGPPMIRSDRRERMGGPDDGPGRYNDFDARGPPRAGSNDEPRGPPPFDGPRLASHRDDPRGAPPPPMPVRDDIRGRAPYRDELRDGPGGYRDEAPRHPPPSRYDTKQEPMRRDSRLPFSSDPTAKDVPYQRQRPPPPHDFRDGPRDGPRDLPRDMPRDLPRDMPRDLPMDRQRDMPRDMARDLQRDMPRDLPRDLPRDMPRDLPKDLPRDMPRDLPRDLQRDPRNMPRDLPRDLQRDPRDMPRDLPRDLQRDPRDMPRDLPRDLQRDPRDMPRDLPRDLQRDPRDIPRDLPRDLQRDPRDMPRDLPRDLPRDMPRDLSRDLPRDMPRDLPRDLPRDMPRDLPRDLPRDMPRDLPRDLPRDMPRDLPRDRDIPRDLPRRDPRGVSDSLGRPPNAVHDRSSRPPPMEMDRSRDFRGGDDFRGGPPGPATNKPIWSAPQGSRSPIPPPGPPRRNLNPSIGEPGAPFRDERPVDMPLADPTRTQSTFDSRGSFSDRGRGRGGGRGFQRGGGMGRGRGRGEFGRFGPGGRGPDDFHRSNREGPGAPVPFRSMESTWKPRPNTGPAPGDSWGGPTKQERDSVPPQEPKQQPPKPMPSSEPASSTASERKVVKPEPVKPVKIEPEEEKGPRPISPPPPGKPSGVVMALARLADLKAQMEYSYAKHMQLVKQQKELQLQAKVLETLPVGIEAFKEELDLVTSEAEANTALYQ